MKRFVNRFGSRTVRFLLILGLLPALVAASLLPGLATPAYARTGDPVAIAWEWEVRAHGELATTEYDSRIEHTRTVVIAGSATVRRVAGGEIVASPFELTLTDESTGVRSTPSPCGRVERERYRISDPQRYGAPDPYFAQGEALAEYEGEGGRKYILNPFGRPRAWFSIKDQAGTRPFTYDEETTITDCNGTRTTTEQVQAGRYSAIYNGADVPLDLPQLEADASGDLYSHTSDYTAEMANGVAEQRTPMRVSIRVTARVLEREPVSPAPSPSPAPPGGAPCVGTRDLTITTGGAGTVSPESGERPVCEEVELTATPASGGLFLGWTIDGQPAGWANPLTLTMDRDRVVVARFAARPSFPDVGAGLPYAEAVAQLAARGVIRGYADGTFGPADPTLRAQMAALIARAMGWDGELHANPFPDQGQVDADLWRAVGTLSHYRVARGYPDGTYRPTDPVLRAQTISFITRAMVAKGYWQQQPDNPALYPNVAAESGHRVDIATYVYYAGPLPGASATGGTWAEWDGAATRGWFAEALWRALDGHFGVDRVP